ncbi:MAG: ABC transporter substrate-binding protein [candidate division NC10 bacterium]|nr:ABC transporter substrate-binding protein [candidate division NC10 bacterium]
MRLRRVALIVTLALCLLAPPLPATAQQPVKVYRIGILHVGLDHVPPPLAGLREGLKALGYEEGKNLRLDFRNVADEEAARATAQAFVRERVDLIVAFENISVRAAKALITEIPVVFFYLGDPAADGLVKSFNRPGGNLTGVVGLVDVHAKLLELFKELVPRLRRLLVLMDPGDPATGGVAAEVRRAAATLKLRLVEREVTVWADVERVFRSVKRGDVDGVYVASPNLRLKFPARMTRLVFEKGLPLASWSKKFLEEGGLFSYSTDTVSTGRSMATY